MLTPWSSRPGERIQTPQPKLKSLPRWLQMGVLEGARWLGRSPCLFAVCRQQPWAS